jgi:hypothetical protein
MTLAARPSQLRNFTNVTNRQRIHVSRMLYTSRTSYIGQSRERHIATSYTYTLALSRIGKFKDIRFRVIDR